MPLSGTVRWYGWAPEHSLVATMSSNPGKVTLVLAHFGCDGPVWHSSVVRLARAKNSRKATIRGKSLVATMSSNPGKVTVALAHSGYDAPVWHSSVVRMARANSGPIPDKANDVPTQRTKIPRQQTHWKLYRYQKEVNVSRTSVLSSRQPKGSSFKRCSNKIAISSLGSQTKNQLWMIDGLCMLMGPPARPDQDSDFSSKHQPANGWSNQSV